MKKLVPLLAVAVALPALVAATPAPAALSWFPCRTLSQEWDQRDTRSECTRVSVPVDYANPEGRRLDLMVSRIKATSPAKRQGVLVVNPGGPGNSGLSLPLTLSRTTVAGMNTDHDVVGFDPRGVGFSGGVECDRAPEDGPDPDPNASPAEKYRQSYEQTAKQNARCTSYDPEFIANLSTDVVARDLDRIRIALGEPKISYYGVSWGTALGAVYRSRYDAHVDRMLLDSVMPPDFSVRTMNDGPIRAAEANFDRFAGWLAARDSQYHLGTTAAQVRASATALAARLDAHPLRTTTPDGKPATFAGANLRTVLSYQQAHWPAMAETLTAARDGNPPPLLGNEPEYSSFGLRGTPYGGLLMQVSVLCNDQGADPSEPRMWREEQERQAASPLFNGQAGYAHWCAGWPLPKQPWHLTRGTSALQLVGHRTELTTPLFWAQEMRRRIGGDLLTVDNGAHGSLDLVACGAKAVEFFSTGRTATGSCPGEPAVSSTTD
ncbi:alpha/beta fold hydrolase [Amycolatopsis sp. FDAARGOS 1241]|uniref:alpha/beta fold hydrolase n=1 Tax=Amycolatopsis sp. FDAARGOS 1241 TaxID=2778070 RepID=UPI00194F9566|nr:alpha/beta fold hydrolase [Amycolatopsis sp. FDAARGOS 1241]QRP47394.1 alpha/beta fold hydrolase [Amycolatopsis sp. FDAARGOS 1241]